MRPLENLQKLEDQDVVAAIVQVVQLVGGEVNCLAIVTRSVVLGRRRLLAGTWAGGVYSLHLRSCRPWRGIVRQSAAPASGRGERKAGLPERPRRRCSVDGTTWARWIYHVWGSGRAPRLEPTPAQISRSAALVRGKGVG